MSTSIDSSRSRVAVTDSFSATASWQGFGAGVELEHREMLSQLLVEARLCLCERRWDAGRCGCGHGSVFLPLAAFAYALRSTTVPSAQFLGAFPVITAAAASAAAPGGMRCLRRCGGASVNAAIAA